MMCLVILGLQEEVSSFALLYLATVGKTKRLVHLPSSGLGPAGCSPRFDCMSDVADRECTL